MAILLSDPAADRCIGALETDKEILISAGTVAESLIVAAHRNIGAEMSSLIDDLGFTIIHVTPASARRIAEAYARWGKGRHPASLNFGDCFAYELAKQNDCPLLYLGDDFARTDIQAAILR